MTAFFFPTETNEIVEKSENVIWHQKNQKKTSILIHQSVSTEKLETNNLHQSNNRSFNPDAKD